MSNPLAIDVAWTKPDYSKVRAAGYVAVIRYVSEDPSKNISPTERDEILGLGLGLGLVWEAGATDWQNSQTAVSEAKQAVEQVQAVGYPPGCVLYAANDASSTLAQVTPGFVAARPVVKDAGYGLGIYAGDTVTDPLVREGVCDAGWQAAAASWGDGQVSAVASLFQRVSHTLPDCGGSYDENVILKFPAGLWFPSAPSPAGSGGGAGAALPVPPPKPSVPAWPGRYLQYPPLLSGADVRAWQAQMKARGWSLTVDGFYGPASRQVCLEFQRQKGLSPDGIVGPISWAAAWTDPITKG